ncbi:MAG: 3-phosphoserine/phosphohydroxythreonine transaminase [Gammaproteobacteria bacterium]|nr:3-phosphoserine/phosphohydroxythreonine transaminase [Gammaproteobacteria bacterium]
MNNRKHNFSAGPCTLPLETLQQAQEEFIDYHGAGMSLIEMSHRGGHFEEIAKQTRELALEIFQAPKEFSALFLQGGATLQFAMVPMNLLHGGARGAYVNSGAWAKGALADAGMHGEVYAAWDGAGEKYTRMPADDEIQLRDNTRYLHITSNETIGGIRFPEWPNAPVPLVGDMSSDYMSREVDWKKFDLIYGGAQKNLGPAGMTVVFVRKSILENCSQNIGRYLRYDIHEANGSMFNTPPVFAIYMFHLVLRWMKSQGGLAAMQRNAAEKSETLYAAIDQSGGYYNCPVARECRSQMNVVFRLPSEALEKKFLAESEAAGLMHLKGHRSVGGCRASIYNAMPLAGVSALTGFMAEFQHNNPA